MGNTASGVQGARSAAREPEAVLHTSDLPGGAYPFWRSDLVVGSAAIGVAISLLCYMYVSVKSLPRWTFVASALPVPLTLAFAVMFRACHTWKGLAAIRSDRKATPEHLGYFAAWQMQWLVLAGHIELPSSSFEESSEVGQGLVSAVDNRLQEIE